MKLRRWSVGLISVAALAASAGMAMGDQQGAPGGGCPGYPCKPAHIKVEAWHRKDLITIKFNEGLNVRLRDGALTDMGKGGLADPATQALLVKYAVAGARWERMHSLDEEILDRACKKAAQNLGKPVADLNLYYLLYLPGGADAATAIDEFNSLRTVEMADVSVLPTPPPAAGNYVTNQTYNNPATDGINANGVRLLPGGTGFNTWVCDCEYSWNTSHIDLPSTTLVTAAPTDPFNDNNHGTAVLGEIFSLNNGVGTTGGAYGSRAFIAAADVANTYNLANAITSAMNAIFPGDVILLEQQTFGPNYTGIPAGTQFGYVPMDWTKSVYDAVVVAVGNNRIVVEAAGNGSQNLDDAVYSTGHSGHWPFTAGQDSGAIIVGAGASPGGSTTDRSRLSFSDYGSTVDLQGYGENVYTTGYGGLFSADGVNSYYTGTFSGTSSASPIVTSACAVFSAIYLNYTGSTPTPAIVRSVLRNTGSPQQSGVNPSSQNIGPRPNLLAAAASIAPAPANNNCGSATVVSNGGQYIGSLLGATSDGAGPCGTSTGNPDVWYAFTAPAYPGTLIASTCGTHDYGGVDTGVDTVLAIFTACGGSSLGCNDDSGGACGATDTSVARDSYLAVTLAAGQSVRIRVSKFGSTNAGPFQLSISYAPLNDSCASAIDVGSGGTFTGTLVGATNDGTGSCGSSATNPDVWYSFTNTAAYPVALDADTCGTHDMGGVDAGMDTVMSILNGCGGAELSCNDDWTSGTGTPCTGIDAGNSRDSSVRVTVAPSQTVKIRVSKFSTVTSGPFVLHVRVLPVNDACNAARAVGEGTYPFSNVGASTDGPVGCPTAVNQDIWFDYTAACTGQAQISLCGSLYDTTLAIYDGSACPPAGSPLACNDDAGPACATTSSSVVVNVVAGNVYKVRVGGFGNNTGTGTMSITCLPTLTGACCSGTTCSVLATAACVGANTRFTGLGTVCNVPGNNTTPCCKADFNQSGTVSVQDIFDFLAAYFANNLQTDINQSAAVSVQDIFDFLAAYFAGCM